MELNRSIPSNARELLPFLVRYRRIDEGEEPRSIILDKLQNLEKDCPELSNRLGGNLGKRLVIQELVGLPGCGRETVERLLEAGFLLKQDVVNTSIDELAKGEGIGKATAEKLNSG